MVNGVVFVKIAWIKIIVYVVFEIPWGKKKNLIELGLGIGSYMWLRGTSMILENSSDWCFVYTYTGLHGVWSLCDPKNLLWH